MKPQLSLAMLLTLTAGCFTVAQEKQSKPSAANDQAKSSEHKYTNALIDSTSPYLLQHAHNPVNWMPWGPEAFAKAKKENKPIFVSIGYSTCFWCHVMERESFENEEVAKVLNEKYIAIKVDREERPDIDEQLMLATQLMTGRGGWPNSVWLTTDGRPWMAGTYFPKVQFIDVLNQLAEAWTKKADLVDQQANNLAKAIREASALTPPASDATIDARPLQRAILEMNQIFDKQHAGFGKAPKFPPHGMLRLLAYAAKNQNNTSANDMLEATLDAMFCGGMHDHVGGGFHRYATDERWFLPHFEKMLYDNAQLIHAYTDAFELAPHPKYRAAIDDIYGWLQREMTHPEGAYYSAIDSESEGGEEGRYYTWSVKELEEAIGKEAAEYFANDYNFQAEGNFTEEATGHRPGTNIPFLARDGFESKLDDPRLLAARKKLRERRKEREYPHLDDKILTAWNGLMISALARAGRELEDPKYIESAETAAKFILNEMMKEDRLLRSWRDGKASLPGYLNDYAFFLDGLVELHRSTGKKDWLTQAEQLSQTMVELFEDKQNGGFYFTSHEHEALLMRSKNLMGGGNLPSGNGVAVHSLLALHELTDDSKYLRTAKRALRSFTDLMLKSPRQVEHLVLAAAEFQALGETSDTARDIASEHKDTAVHARVTLTSSSLPPAGKLQGTLRLSIQSGFHLYSPEANDGVAEGDVRTFTVSLTSLDKNLKLTPEFPAGKQMKDPVLDKVITIYADEVTVPFQCSWESPLKPGKQKVSLQFEYQACDDQRCLIPVKVPLEFEITIQE